MGNISQCPICQVKESLVLAWDLADVSFATMTNRSGAAMLEFILCDDSYQRTYTGPVKLPEYTVC